MLGTISKRTVDALRAGTTLWDAALPGFGVRCQSKAKVYVVKYRAGGRQRFVTIGKHGPITAETARKEAKRQLGQVAGGKDPADEKAEARDRAADTLGLWVVRYLKHAETRQRPKTHYETDRYLTDDWKPLHRLSVFHIRRRHIAARVAELTEAGGPVAATRARAALSAMFNWAIRDGLDIPANPVIGTNRPAVAQTRERVLTDGELAAIWRSCADDDYGRIVRLLILTGQRRDEIGGMRWSELVGDSFVIPSTRTKNHREHTLPLVPAALTLIEAQPRRNDRDFIFGDGPRKSGDPGRGYSGWSKSKAALDARIAEAGHKLEPFVIHDLRRTAATMMADRLGVLPHIIEAILNHVSGHRAGVAGIYNKARYLSEMREALTAWSREVARIVAGRPRAVTLRRVVAANVG